MRRRGSVPCFRLRLGKQKKLWRKLKALSVERYVADIERRLCELLSKNRWRGKMRSHDNRFDVGTERIFSDTEKNGDNSSIFAHKDKNGRERTGCRGISVYARRCGGLRRLRGRGKRQRQKRVAEVVERLLGIDQRTLVSVAKRK